MPSKSSPERAESRKQSTSRARTEKPATDAKAGPSKSAKSTRAPSGKSAAKPAKSKSDEVAGSPAKKRRAKAAPSSTADVLARLRATCLALPETTEKEAWQTPTFRVRDKMFAMFAEDHHGDGRIAVWCKAPVGAQEALVESDPDHFFRPPYVGPSGWVGVRLDRGLDWSEVADIVREGWRVAAPKKLAATLDD